ncbi:MAG: hemerythrin family protein [Candidatus Brocadiales bacterium]|nr:hemerythrin family protein [Candidatus Brocadiales bacterium]
MIKWEGKYSVNIAMLDEEHKKIIGIVNAVTIADQHSYTLDKVAEIMNDMITYARKHFKSEEEYMIKFKYPAYQSHKAEHVKFLERITFYHNRLVLNDYVVENNIFDILNHFKHWLIDHIQVVDKGYTDCFNENGLK